MDTRKLSYEEIKSQFDRWIAQQTQANPNFDATTLSDICIYLKKGYQPELLPSDMKGLISSLIKALTLSINIAQDNKYIFYYGNNLKKIDTLISLIRDYLRATNKIMSHNLIFTLNQKEHFPEEKDNLDSLFVLAKKTYNAPSFTVSVLVQLDLTILSLFSESTEARHIKDFDELYKRLLSYISNFEETEAPFQQFIKAKSEYLKTRKTHPEILRLKIRSILENYYVQICKIPRTRELKKLETVNDMLCAVKQRDLFKFNDLFQTYKSALPVSIKARLWSHAGDNTKVVKAIEPLISDYLSKVANRNINSK